MSNVKHRPTWTLKGFHARVKMAKDFNLFIVTEGNEADAYFYDKLARASLNQYTNAVKVYPVAHLTRDESKPVNTLGQPGKTSVINAYEATKLANTLVMENKSGKRAIVFTVDRDLTEAHVPYEHDPHFCVTNQRDVEAEIFHNADTVAAVQLLVSVDQEDAIDLVNRMGAWKEDLATRWREWITLGAIVASMPSAPPGVKWAERSLLNDDTYGPVNPAREKIFEDKIKDKLEPHLCFDEEKRIAEQKIQQIKNLYGEAAAVKGKWYYNYWEYYLRPMTKASRGRIQAGALLAFSSSLDYTAPWSQHYVSKFDKLFSIEC